MPPDPRDLAPRARRASALLQAMANERRLLVLCHLSTGEKSVGELAVLVGLGQSALSQHLARLRADGLVTTRRRAQSVLYSLAGREAAAIMETLYGLYCAPRRRASAAAEQPPRPHAPRSEEST